MSWQLRAEAELERRKRNEKASIIPYDFRGGNAEMLESNHVERIVEGPAETGKTLAWLTYLHRMARQHPGAHFSIIRKKKTDLIGSVIRTFTRDILEKYGQDVTKYGGNHPQWYDYPNGSRIWLGGLDDPGKTLSSERDGIYVNQVEELGLPDWEYLTRCVTGRGSVIPFTFLGGDCNPGPPTHWIKSRAKTGKLALFQTTHKDNPTLWDGENWTAQGIKSRSILANLTGSRLLRLYHGLWAIGEGAIYDIFDEVRHKVAAFDPPKLWPRFVGIDPFGAYIGALWLAFDPHNQVLNVYREYYEPFGITTTGHAQNVVELSQGETIFAWVGGGPSERQARMDWTAAGIPLMEPPISEVWAQIDRVYNLLKTNSLVIHDSCPALLSEIGEYRRKLKDGQPTEQIENKDAMHLLDSLRYIVAWLSQPQVEEEQGEIVYNPARIW